VSRAASGLVWATPDDQPHDADPDRPTAAPPARHALPWGQSGRDKSCVSSFTLSRRLLKMPEIRWQVRCSAWFARLIDPASKLSSNPRSGYNPSHRLTASSIGAISAGWNSPNLRRSRAVAIVTRPWASKAPGLRKDLAITTSKRVPCTLVVCGTSVTALDPVALGAR